MKLKDLIDWLKQQDEKSVVTDGFGSPHCDRGYYEHLAFDPVEQTTFGEMLKHAKAANGKTFTGWKGGDYKMHDYTTCKIGIHGECGEEITTAHCRLWLLTANAKVTGLSVSECPVD